ncbi:asparagine synthase-domain-containing protein [Schizophyllum fasciatum]
MCGICFVLRKNAADGEDDCTTLTNSLMDVNAARGPDAQRACTMYINDTKLVFYASELRLRGDNPVVQPHEGDGNVLCWNGEIFGGLDVSPHENDGLKLFVALGSLSTVEQVVEFFGTLEGPYAFVYYQHRTRSLIFGRDPLGRRSLLVHKPTAQQPYFILSSTSTGAHSGCRFEELSTTGLFLVNIDRLDENNNVDDMTAAITVIDRAARKNLPYANLSPVNMGQPPEDLPLVGGLASDLPPYLETAATEFLRHLEDSIRRRVFDIPEPGTKGEARVGVLFSGGIDCSVLALLADRYTPSDEPIDLLNVAFENPRKLGADVDRNAKRKTKPKPATAPASPPQKPAYMVPDRVTGLEEVEELRRLCPRRVWNFVEVNIPFEETQAARSAIEETMYPCRTVMDLSLAQALYFAAKGEGSIREHPGADPRPYTSRARVLLNGLGSDELLGGYGRHRTAFKAGGWGALTKELQLELDRLPTRNLGRDDRIISAHGKEARHPFLSLDVVRFLAALPVHAKTDPRLGQGTGDKLLLRVVAWRLGLVEASTRPKRAMQFGSHSARMQADSAKKGDLLLES